MKENWICHKITERPCSKTTRTWFIKAPSGNYYVIDKTKRGSYIARWSKFVEHNLYNPECVCTSTFNEAIKAIYKMEKSFPWGE